MPAGSWGPGQRAGPWSGLLGVCGSLKGAVPFSFLFMPSASLFPSLWAAHFQQHPVIWNPVQCNSSFLKLLISLTSVGERGVEAGASDQGLCCGAGTGEVTAPSEAPGTSTSPTMSNLFGTSWPIGA